MSPASVRMSLREVLVLDCQAAGATPVHGDLLGIAWARGAGPIVARNLVPARPVSPIVRKLTGWSEALLTESVDPLAAWRELVEAAGAEAPVPTVIHYARFELPFLRDLHARTTPDAPFPLDIVCLHAIAARLFPDLPRRNLRALSGHLGHSPELLRRAAGHVEATSFVWNALMPRLDAIGDWSDVKAWLATPERSTRSAKRKFPLAPEKRKALPDRPGVYRFHRPNGDILYVGKAASIRKRVSGHFVAAQRGTERALEMLTQVDDVSFVETGSPLEAALLEADEIKRLDPPYNVHLRSENRAPAFASRDWQRTSPVPDADHVLGPLPSTQAIAGIAALRRHLEGSPLDDALRAAILGIRPEWAPPASMFDPVLGAFVAAHLDGAGRPAARIVAAGERLASPEADPTTEGWNPERIERGLTRTVVEESRLLRRARVLTLLADATITYREPKAPAARSFGVTGTTIPIGSKEARPSHRAARRATFIDAASYDRMRVLVTELTRVVTDGGEVAIRIGRHTRKW